MYHSTRGTERVSASEALERGLAPDGGLYVMDRIPHLSVMSVINLSYPELACRILAPFLDDFTPEEIATAVKNAYDARFTTPEVVSLHATNAYHYLETWHGATFAFKDVALSVLPELMLIAKAKNEFAKKTVILTATSGDTGSAALAGFQRSKTAMFVFYPHGGVSEIQKRQMLSFSGDNRHAIALEGNFDDAQNFVKKIFADQALKNSLLSLELSSANSINIGRLIPQVVYYYYSYRELLKEGTILPNELVDFVVPTGNFGDVLAGYLAKRMGLPIGKLVVASDRNHVLTDFFRTGTYDKNRAFVKTISPSMDILISSNLERLLYYITLSTERVNELMKSLRESGKFTLTSAERAGLADFATDWASEEETRTAIGKTWKDEGYLIDPHTGVARAVAERYKGESTDHHPLVIISTASPYKFSPAMMDSLHLFHHTAEFANIDDLARVTQVPVPEGIARLKDFQAEEVVWTLSEAEEKLKSALKELDQ